MARYTDDDKIVTHAHLSMLRDMKARLIPEMDGERDLLNRLIAAAEADAPPLPEGWVVRKHGAAHYHRDGVLYSNADCTQVTWREHDVARELRDGTLSPLRPTVTEADVEKAAKAAYDDQRSRPGAWSECKYKELNKRSIRAAFRAAGVEVTS